MMKRFHTWYEWTSLSNFKYRKHIFCTQDENEPLFVVFPTGPAPVASGLFQNPWEFQSQMPQPQKDSQPSLLLSSNEGKSNLKEYIHGFQRFAVHPNTVYYHIFQLLVGMHPPSYSRLFFGRKVHSISQHPCSTRDMTSMPMLQNCGISEPPPGH